MGHPAVLISVSLDLEHSSAVGVAAVQGAIQKSEFSAYDAIRIAVGAGHIEIDQGAVGPACAVWRRRSEPENISLIKVDFAENGAVEIAVIAFREKGGSVTAVRAVWESVDGCLVPVAIFSCRRRQLEDSREVLLCVRSCEAV